MEGRLCGFSWFEYELEFVGWAFCLYQNLSLVRYTMTLSKDDLFELFRFMKVLPNLHSSMRKREHPSFHLVHGKPDVQKAECTKNSSANCLTNGTWRWTSAERMETIPSSSESSTQSRVYASTSSQTPPLPPLAFEGNNFNFPLGKNDQPFAISLCADHVNRWASFSTALTT